jgi:FtsH-binding integral membrane protein
VKRPSLKVSQGIGKYRTCTSGGAHHRQSVTLCTTKDDFSVVYGMLMVLVVSALYFVILMPLLYESMPYEVACSCLFVLVYGLYIIVDVQLIAGEGQYNLSTDDYILGSLYLYIDIIGMFIRILRLIGKKKEQA